MEDLFKLIDSEIRFEDAIDYFKNKVPIKAKAFYALQEEYKTLAFTVAGYTKAQVINKFYDEILSAIESGTTMQEFKSKMNTFLVGKGYDGLTNYQADNIFRTNVQTSFQVGHYKAMMDDEVTALRPYWEYDAVNDSQTRKSHLAMSGRVYRYDNPIWDTWYPPNGFRCRCSVNTLSERQVKERGMFVEEDAPVAVDVNGEYVPVLPDKQFGTNPAKKKFEPDLEGYPESLKKAFNKHNNRKGV